MKPSVSLDVVADDTPVTPSDPPEPGSSGDPHGHPLAFDLDVVSDVICPWCWVGKRRLEQALALLGPHVGVAVTWRPFQLNPSMPPEGMDRRRYIEAKFGSIERYQMMEARLAAAGAAEGINFRFDRLTRIPNTLDAHRLIGLAAQHGKQDAVLESLFRAYFEDAADIADRNTLVAVAAAAGVDATAAERMLATDENRRAIAGEEWRFRAMGIQAVPSFVIGESVLFSGAVEPRLMAKAFRQIGLA